MASIDAWNDLPGAVWLELHHEPGDRTMGDSRLRFLGRLNERRYLLERDLEHPLVLVLPVDSRVQARMIAPDLWHVRALSEQLAAGAVAKEIEVSPGLAEAGDTLKASVVVEPLDEPAEVVEWHRVRAGPLQRI